MRAASGGTGVALFALAYAGSAAVLKGFGFLLFMWFAHSLSVDDYARFGLLYALQAGVAALAMAGIIETTIGGLRTARSTERRQRLLSSANAIHIGGAILSVCIVSLGFSWSETFDWVALLVAAVGGALTSFFMIQSQLSRIVQNHRVALIIGFAPQMIGLLSGFAGFLIDGSSFGFFAGYAFGLVLSLPLARLAHIGVFNSDVDQSNVKYILGHIGPFIFVAFLDWFAGYGNTYLVKMFFSNEMVARFVFAYTISSIMHLIATSLNQAWSPRVFEMIHSVSVEDVEKSNRKFYALQGLVLGLFGGILIIIMSLIMAYFDESMSNYKNLHIEILILFSAYVFVIPWYHAQNYYYAHASGAVLMRVSIVSNLIGLLMWIASALLLGPLGAYVGFMLMMIAKMVGGVFWARRQWRIHILWEGPAIGFALLLLGGLANSRLIAWQV